MKQWIKRKALLGRPTTLLLKLSRLKSNNLTTTLKGRPAPHTTISDKCGDPYIVERNPHIHDPDDVFPKRLVKITHTGEKKSWKKKLWDEKKKLLFLIVCEKGVLVFK